MPLNIFLAVLLTLLAEPVTAQRGRYMPPDAVGCDRNNLTSYIGEVTRYNRDASGIRITLKTDDGTVEDVGFGPGDKILLNGVEMQESEWRKVEEKTGKLKAGMRAIAWICRGGRPVLDWRPPQR